MRIQGDRNNKAATNVRAIFDVVMGLIYLSVGSVMVLGKYFGIEIHFPPKDVLSIFGALSAAYGVFRIYRGIKTWNNG